MIGQTPQDASHEDVTDAPAGAGSKPAADEPGKQAPKEWGGREGPEPTRYGDWEKNGRCIDF